MTPTSLISSPIEGSLLCEVSPNLAESRNPGKPCRIKNPSPHLSLASTPLMELHSPAAAKRLWCYIRVSFFMIRKGLVSKRKLAMDMNLMLKRGNKLMGKAFSNLVFHHHHHHRVPPRGHGYGLQEYEFSCTTSPNPVFFHAKRSRLNYFRCISTVDEEEDETPEIAGKVISGISPVPSQELSLPSSPVSSSSSSSEERDGFPGGGDEVDGDAEKFIKKFYSELRRQSRMALIQYEMEYKDMLARGS